MKMNLIHGDCLEEMKNIPDGSVDLIITDPPYGLSFMGKKWDKGVPDVAFWAEMLRVLKPGGYLMSFSGTRTYHRMATAIEDAGFEVRDMIEWVYGSGFPKSHNIGKAVDKLQGNEREVVGKKSELSRDGANRNPKNHDVEGTQNLHIKTNWDAEITKGTSEWEGWGTALKPAHEPICMARKPLSEKTVAKNCLKWGTGGINIDESRAKHNEPEKLTNRTPRTDENIFSDDSCGFKKETNHIASASQLGRFPANLIHDNSEEVTECFPDTKSGKVKEDKNSYEGGGVTGFLRGVSNQDNQHGDQGNASRYFKSIIYQAKASKKERSVGNNHPTVKPLKLMEYLVKMASVEGGVILDPFMGSGTTGVACKNLNRRFIGIELDEEYFEIAKKRINGVDEE